MSTPETTAARSVCSEPLPTEPKDELMTTDSMHQMAPARQPDLEVLDWNDPDWLARYEEWNRADLERSIRELCEERAANDAVAVPQPALEPVYGITRFPKLRQPDQYRSGGLTWPALCAWIVGGLDQERESKEALPLWGPYALPRGAGRADSFVTSLSCAVLDIDHGNVDPETIVAAIRKLGIAALVYESPRSRSAEPDVNSEWRLRVVAPLASPAKGSESEALRRDLAERLGVELDGSTIDRSRPFYVGRLVGTPAREHWIVEGTPIPVGEWCKGWATAEPKSVATAGTTRARSSRLGQAFERAGLLGDDLPNGQGIAVECPWSHEHSPNGGDTATAIFPPKTGGSGLGGFECKHAHCAARSAEDAIRELEKRTGRGLVGNLGGPECSAALIVSKVFAKGPDGNTIEISRPRPCQANVQAVFELHHDWRGVIAFNEFTGDVVKRLEPPTREHERRPGAFSPEWTEADTARAKSWFAKNLGFEPENHQIEAAILVAAERNPFHPVRAYLDGLKWDGTPRLAGWLSGYMGARQDGYTAAVGAQLLIGMCARVYRPGCKLDTVVVFEGPQGKRKSTACGILAGEWFSDTALDIGTKDAMQSFRGNWIIELAELASIKSARAIEGMKSFLTSRIDDYRPSYGRRNRKIPRQCVLIATHNPDGCGYLVDPTGNRRFLPVECGDIDVDALSRDRDQLFAEAVTRYQAGEQWWLDGDALQTAVEEQAARAEEDAWTSAVVQWLTTPTHREYGGPGPAFGLGSGVTASDVLSHALGIPVERQDRRAVSRVGAILRVEGWAPRGKARPRRYHKPGAGVANGPTGANLRE